MSGGYYYLVASLPHLRLGAAPRLTTGQFLSRCAAQVSAAHYRILAGVERFQVQPTGTGLALLDRWYDRECALRTALAVVRAQRLGVAAAAHLRNFRQDPSLAEIAQRLLMLDSPLAADEELDRVRWRLLEELAFDHYFDLEALVIYRLKLRILERRARFDPATGAALLDRMLAQGAERGRETFTHSGN
jgi:hypothetical protein